MILWNSGAYETCHLRLHIVTCSSKIKLKKIDFKLTKFVFDKLIQFYVSKFKLRIVSNIFFQISKFEVDELCSAEPRQFRDLICFVPPLFLG